MRILLFLYLLLVPNAYTYGGDLRLAQQMMFQVASTIIFFSLLFCEKRRVPLTKVSLGVGLFGIWSMFLYQWFHQMGGTYLMNILNGILVYYATISCIKVKDTKFLFKGIITVFCMATVYSTSQLLGYDIIGFIMRNSPSQVPEPCGLFGLPAHFGIYVGVAMVVIAYFNPYLSLIGFFGLYLSKSTGAVMGATCGYLLVLWYKRFEYKVPFVWSRLVNWRKIKRPQFFKVTLPLYIPMALLIFTGAFGYIKYVDMPMGMFKTRPHAWGLMINRAMQNPITGWGLDSLRYGDMRFYKAVTPEKTIRAVKKDNQYILDNNALVKYKVPPGTHFDWWDNCHSEYVQLLLEFGVIGFLIIGFIIKSMFDRVWKKKLSNEAIIVTGIMVVLLVSATVQFPFHLARLGHLLPVVLGLFMVNTEKK